MNRLPIIKIDYKLEEYKRMIFDTHAHYDDEDFDIDRKELIDSMNSNGIGRIVNVGANLKGSAESVKLSLEYDNIYAAVGIHPSDVYEMDDKSIGKLKELSKEKKVVAIGEIGLDYHYPDTDKDIQKEWFIKQLDLAVELNMPVIIHSRDAAADTMEILKDYVGKVSGVIHCYSYGIDMAKQYVEMGYYIGIGGVLTFKNAKKLIEVAKMISIDKIVLETDCPYLSPEPNRGKRNDSTNLKFVVKKLAELKEMTEEDVIKITYKNGLDLYRMG